MPSADHDPTGHVIAVIGGHECGICGQPVKVVEWITGEDGMTRWRWEHYDKTKEGRV